MLHITVSCCDRDSDAVRTIRVKTITIQGRKEGSFHDRVFILKYNNTLFLENDKKLRQILKTYDENKGGYTFCSAQISKHYCQVKWTVSVKSGLK